MPFVTLRVTHSVEDAERPERHTHAEHGYDGVLQSTLRSRSPRHLSFLTLQRGNACRDALRHIISRGRKASRTAYPRGAWVR
ncbi:hypothetical protein B1F69_29865 [Pseudomonas syringae]|nr:hypothetical protein B1F69_29865 [Pseudomonas syringae]